MAAIERTIEPGGAKKLDGILRRFDAAADYVSRHHDALLREYADRWIGVDGVDGVVASSASRAGLIRAIQKKAGRSNTLYVTFLTRQRQTLIL